MDGDGVSVGEAVLAELVTGEAFDPAVVHADRQRTVEEIDGFDDAAFAGDDLPIGGGGEGHDEVSGGVVAAVGGEVGSVQAAGDGAAVAGDPVEGVHVGAPPCVHGHVRPVDHRLPGRRPPQA